MLENDGFFFFIFKKEYWLNTQISASSVVLTTQETTTTAAHVIPSDMTGLGHVELWPLDCERSKNIDCWLGRLCGWFTLDRGIRA